MLEPAFCSRIDRKRETEPLRGEVDGFLPLIRHQSPVLGENAKLMATTCENAK